MNQEDIDKFVYAEAKNFLLDLYIAGVDSLLIEKYLSPTSLQPCPDSIPAGKRDPQGCNPLLF